MSGAWELSTSCAPYSNDRYIYDGRNAYFAGYDDCCPCGCRLVRQDPDGDVASDGRTRDLSTYWCARCGEEVERDMVFETADKPELMRAIAEALFPTPAEPDRTPCFMSVAKADAESNL